MNWFRRLFHRHRHELVAVNDEYHTKYTDTGSTVYHQMRFYRCNCGHRKFETNKSGNVRHEGIKKAQLNWIDTGVVPKKSYHPTKHTSYVKIDDLEREKLDPVVAYQKTLEDIQQSLAVVINRDFDLESRYPKLKQAADQYHRQLDKYRNFEKLKEKSQ
jgi:hypothetical protein